MARRPVIGVSAYDLAGSPEAYYLPKAYADAVRASGAIPFILPPAPEDAGRALELTDGILLSGGGDVDPKRYGGAAHASVYHVSPSRDEFEAALVAGALERDRPVLAICRGLQVLNVALGGDLHEHLPDVFGDRVLHRDPDRMPTSHAVTVEPASRLAEVVGVTAATVRSRHHQGARRVGERLRAVAWSEDGVIEALEIADRRFCVAVQWHPELALEDAVTRRLFGAFVAACS